VNRRYQTEAAYHDAHRRTTALMKIRPAELRDRARIHEILVATARFTEDEVRAAMDLADSAQDHPEKGEYIVHVLEEPDSGPKKLVQGYVCYGPTPHTDGVFDLYWIAVDPKRQGQGIGQLLLRFVENEVRRQRGRMLLIETSSKESYAPTLKFYESSGYDEISRIKDFYRIENDKVIYCKKLTPS
jgi:ribosomal protein S18 acetylase RimI-like enzyme